VLHPLKKEVPERGGSYFKFGGRSAGIRSEVKRVPEKEKR